MIGVYALGTRPLGVLDNEDALGSKDPYAGVFDNPAASYDVLIEIEHLISPETAP